MEKLPKLNNIIDDIVINEEEFEKEFNDLKECLFILIDEYIENNIDLYKYENFEEFVADNVYDQFLEVYPYDLINIDIQHIIDETMHMYFISNNKPRSYPDTYIIKKNNKKKNKKILNSRLNKERPEQRTSR